MKTCIYQGSIRLVEKSGVGRAIHQQIRELQIAGSEQGDLNDPETAVVHINTAFPDSVAAALKAKRHGKKVIWYEHSTGEDFENSFRLSNVADSIFRRWLVWCYAKADAIITPTEYSRDIIRGYG